MHDVMLTGPQLAAELGVDPSTVYRWVQRREVIPTGYIGSIALFSRECADEVKAWHASRGDSPKTRQGQAGPSPTERPVG